MSIFICPVCSEKLALSGKSYICPKNHCFDMAKSGYLNLLTAKHGTVHGDNKFMLRARRDFLEKGYYSPLREAVCETVIKYAEQGNIILDAGCGEGYYTSAVKLKLEIHEFEPDIYGIDISKYAVEMAAKRRCCVNFAVASVFHIPVQSKSCDILLTMFAPYCKEEYLRVLKSDGIMIMAIPSTNHLWELKKAVYDTPYKNEVKPYELDGFSHIGTEHINFTMKIDNKADIQSLFSMTPYYYRTGKSEQERLNNLEYLETQADFEILTYKKTEKD